MNSRGGERERESVCEPSPPPRDCQSCVIGARLRSWEPGCLCLSGEQRRGGGGGGGGGGGEM